VLNPETRAQTIVGTRSTIMIPPVATASLGWSRGLFVIPISELKIQRQLSAIITVGKR
jgi:hypothetical protein